MGGIGFRQLTQKIDRNQIYSWAYRILQNHHDAMDATQEVLLRATRKNDSDIENPKAWFRRITINLCIDTLRKREKTEEYSWRQIETPSPQNNAYRNELRDAVVKGLESLSEKQRSVLIAKVYDQDTFADIADSMGISPSSVKTHYLRALQGLRGPLLQHAEFRRSEK